jgi:hypothetical protein
MADFFDLSRELRTEALDVAAQRARSRVVLLEKDIWVVWTLSELFGGAYAGDLVFKGGTSLSKAYGYVRRFSEDVDVTYDIRALAGDLVGDTDPPIPATRAQARKWTDTIRGRLPEWLSEEIAPPLRTSLETRGMPATIRVEGDRIFVDYEATSAGSEYVKPEVMLEFGARSTGEPATAMAVVCDAAEYVPDVTFPTATPRVMSAQRTFWEKATAIHVFCLQGTTRGGERFSRHWHDIARLNEVGVADAAIGDRTLARAVAAHKQMFFREKDADGNVIDYARAVSGGLRLVPDHDAAKRLEYDYLAMAHERLLIDNPQPFSDLMAQCQQIQEKANR